MVFAYENDLTWRGFGWLLGDHDSKDVISGVLYLQLISSSHSKFLHSVITINYQPDPIDVVEIGSKSLDMGSVTEVKPLGVIAMIDDGELDWKVLAVAVDDPLAAEYNDIDDVPLAVQDGIREWFRWYKTPDDKPLNGFGFDEKYLNAAETEKVIEETHNSWKKLKAGETDAGKLWLN